MELLAVRNAHIAAWQSGNGPRDLLFVHGFQNDHSGWQPLLDLLPTDHYRFTAVDLVGCGASSTPASWERCTIDEYAADIVAVCDALGLDRPTVIGHSLGAAIGLRAVLDSPSRLAALALISPASTRGLDFVTDEAGHQALRHPTPEQQMALARAAFRHQPNDDEFARLIATIRRATPEHIEGAARSMADFAPDLSALDMPALLICGDRDRHVPLRNHLATWRGIPRCGLQVYFDVGHVPFVEVTEACAADLQRFLVSTS